MLTNGDKIRNMTDEDLANYIYAVYLAGQIKQKYGLNHLEEIEVDYITWLKQEVANNEEE